MIQQQVSRMQKEFPDMLDRVEYQLERIVLDRQGKPIAAILHNDDIIPSRPHPDLPAATEQSTTFMPNTTIPESVDFSI